MKRFKQIYWIGVLLAGMLFPAIGNCEVFQVKLRDGRVLRVRQYYEKGDTIFLLRYNNYIGMDKSEVVEITKAQDSSEEANAAPVKQKSSSTKASTSQKAGTRMSSSQKAGTGTSGSRKASGDKLKSAVEPFKRLTSGSQKNSR
jgi:hypothetical protein